jgi:homoserine O-acetyltransferase
MTTYRTPEELRERFGGDGEALDGWLGARGRDFAGRFDAASYAVISRAIDRSRVEPERIRVPATLVAFLGDRLVPLELSRELRDRLSGPAELFEVPSRFGHDGFLKEVEALSSILRGALEVSP